MTKSMFYHPWHECPPLAPGLLASKEGKGYKPHLAPSGQLPELEKYMLSLKPIRSCEMSGGKEWRHLVYLRGLHAGSHASSPKTQEMQ